MFVFGSLPDDPQKALNGVLTEDAITAQAGLFTLARAGHAVLTAIEDTAERHGLTPAQFRLLMVLKFVHPDGAPMSLVAQDLGVKAPSLTELVASSEELFERAPSPADRRQVVLSASRAGSDRLLAVLPEMAAFAVGLRSALGEGTWGQLIDLTDQLFDSMEESLS